MAARLRERAEGLAAARGGVIREPHEQPEDIARGVAADALAVDLPDGVRVGRALELRAASWLTPIDRTASATNRP